MNAVDVKDSSELIKSVAELIKVGATDEHRQAFGRTIFGTLLGQTVVLLGMILTYVVMIAVIRRYFLEDLEAFHSAVGGWFWLILTAPIVCILLTSVLPTAWQARRERRMKAAAIGGGAHFEARSFRPYPYGAADRDAYKRPDGADATILKWLLSTEASLLYLSGASGVGKSSLVAASLLPQLRDSGWMVIKTRLLGDPIDRLRADLLASDARLAKAEVGLSLHDLLRKAADARTKKGHAPILLVIDQFEEFLILHHDDHRQALAAFLGDLVKRPIAGLRLLLVFRSDYRPLIFKLDLPPLIAGDNWNELAPYDRHEAMAFLQSGGYELSPEAINRLFRGLDRIEDAPGIYRLITLNMVGLVLERMGRTLEGDPSRLIQSYLATCLTTTESRDFAKPLLAQMITEAGTKEPRSETDLATLTGFESWQVKATLAELTLHGLVRRLEGTTAIWEIAHDFLARVIGQLIGRLKPNIFLRVRPLVAPVVLLGWILLAVLAMPYWQQRQDRIAQEELRKLGATIAAARPSGIRVSLPKWETILTDAQPHLKRLSGLKALDFYGTGRMPREFTIKTLEPLEGLTNLESLTIPQAVLLTSLEPLSKLPNLNTLIVYDIGLTSLESLKGLTQLTRLEITRTDGFDSLEPLRGLTKLKSLNLAFNHGFKDLQPLKGLINLQELDLSFNPNIISLEPLRGLTSLQQLDISSDPGITTVEPLKGLKNLQLRLSATGRTGISTLEPLKGTGIRVFASEQLLATMK